MARDSVAYLISEVRRIAGAGTSEYTVGTISYFTDDQIERILDSRRVRLSRYELSYEEEIEGGSTVYKHSRVGYGWLEDTSGGTAGFVLTDSNGTVIAGTVYTLSPEDGFIEFLTDQVGSARYVTGWVHNPYKAAYDVLLSWLSDLSKQVDWASDNMRVSRGQKSRAIREQMELIKELAGMTPHLEVGYMDRSDILVEEIEENKVKYDKIVVS